MHGGSSRFPAHRGVRPPEPPAPLSPIDPETRALSKHAAYAPKHRAVPERPLAEAPKKALKATLVLSAMAVAGTGATVAGGIVLSGSPTVATAADVAGAVAGEAAAPSSTPSVAVQSSSTPSAAAVRRSQVVSRSDRRDAVDAVDPAKAAALGTATGTAARVVVQTEDLGSTGDPKAIASALLGSYGWSGSQFSCLVNLWNRESGWRTTAANPSGAYGIPQALPGSKMASAGADWRTDAETQIKWGLGYIHDRYGSPCGAWGHSQATGWY